MEQSFALKRVKDVFWVLAMAGLVAGVGRMFFGLGAATYMSDALPWGMWKIFNMVAGAALATGGFVTACIIYIFHLEKYRPLARAAIVVAFLGYGSSLFSLLFDIGLPHRFWHPFLMWNPHSFLFEVFWCVSCYWMVTGIELLPIIFERLPWQQVAHFLHEMVLPIVVVGITLSCLHHSSLGSLFMVSPTRLHPLWFSTWIPWEFISSAVGSGMAVIILVTMLYSWLYGKKLNMPVLTGMAKGSAAVLILYFVIRAIDFTVDNKWGYVFGPDLTWESGVYWVEILLEVVVPVGVFLVPRLRNNPATLALGAVSAVVGLSMYRIDAGIVGYFTSAGEIYYPSLSEVLLSLGILSAAGLVFFFLVENFHVFEAPESCRVPETEGVHADQVRQWTLEEFLSIIVSPDALRISAIVVVTIPLSILVLSNQAAHPFQPLKQPVQKPAGVDLTRSILKIDGNRGKEFVNFPHQYHQELMGGADSCIECHHLSLPRDQASACYLCHRDMMIATSIFDHDYHQEYYGGKKSCSRCHNLNLPKGPENVKQTCFDCHEKDMPGMAAYPGRGVSHLAAGYKDAMHGKCLTCHRKYAELTDNFELGTCQTCHPREVPKTTAMAR